VPRNPLQAIAFLLGLALAIWLSPLRGSATGSDAPDPALASLESALLADVNAVRHRSHRMPLRRSPELDAVARAHSRDMAARGYLAHESPEGANAVVRLEAARLTGFTLAAENIGSTNRPAPNQEIVTGWLNSQMHRTNLLAPAFNTTGIGIARAPDGSLLYTQLYVTYPRAE
jgi:uncharacterized protein YkwD